MLKQLHRKVNSTSSLLSSCLLSSLHVYNEKKTPTHNNLSKKSLLFQSVLKASRNLISKNGELIRGGSVALPTVAILNVLLYVPHTNIEFLSSTFSWINENGFTFQSYLHAGVNASIITTSHDRSMTWESSSSCLPPPKPIMVYDLFLSFRCITMWRPSYINSIWESQFKLIPGQRTLINYAHPLTVLINVKPK